jgi:hypothetical protein
MERSFEKAKEFLEKLPLEPNKREAKERGQLLEPEKSAPELFLEPVY